MVDHKKNRINLDAAVVTTIPSLKYRQYIKICTIKYLKTQPYTISLPCDGKLNYLDANQMAPGSTNYLHFH